MTKRKRTLGRGRKTASGSSESARNAGKGAAGLSIRTPQSAILLGAHMSIGGGVHMAIERACSIECTAMQIFVKNNMQWFGRPLTADEITTFLNHQQRNQLQSVFAHANYLINLAARTPQFHFNSM